MAPKKVVPKGTDDIIELTDIVEPGMLPAEADSGLTDATFEDELDSMLADVPELSAAAKDLDAAPAAKAAPAAAPAADDDFADLDSLLEELGDDLADSKPPAPKAPPAAAAEAVPAEDDLLDVDDLLAEVGAGDTADFAVASAPEATATAEEDIVDVDKFLADFEDAETAAPAASEQVIDAAAVGSDDLLAELQSAAAPEPEPDLEEDDLLAELKSVMGGDLADAPPAAPVQPETPAPAAELEPEPVPEFNLDELDLTVSEPEIAAPAAEPEAEAVEEPAVEPAAPEAVPTPMDDDPMAMAAAAMAAPAEPGAPAGAEEGSALGDEELQHLDALLDDILQPTAPPSPAPEPEIPAAPEAAEAAPVEEIELEPPLESEPELEAVEPEPEPEPETAEPELEIESVAAAEIPSEPAPEAALAPPAAPVVDTEALLAELLAEDSPLLATVRDMVRQETETRLAALEERLVENLDKAAAKAAAQIIREEIAALAQDME